MFTSNANYRVRYADTDQMGVVYYGNYPRFYEIGRSEMIRDMGYSYRELEESGVFMPVHSIECRYHKPLYYDELITIQTTLREIPSVRMNFYHTIFNQKGEEVHDARATLVFLSRETSRPVRVPERLLSLLENIQQQKK